MRPHRYLLIILAALMLLAPSALAAGPSAGDQQYTDPLAGSNGTSNSGSSNGSSSTGSGSSAPASSGATASATPTASPPASATTATAAPTATTAQGTNRTLPRTGFDAWVGAAFGVILLAAGLAVRRQVLRPYYRQVRGRYIR